MRIHVVADEADKDGGHFHERLLQLGGELVELDRDDLPAYASIGDTDLIFLLGSDKGAHEPKWKDVVEAESRFVRGALRAGTPVMGICYGAQLMARALGGTSWRADQPELGWQRVDTIDPILCPEGPWAQMHSDVFAPGPTSNVIGTSWRGPQCFIDEAHGARAIAWQFHPEVTAETYERWVHEGYYGAVGIDTKDLIRQAHAHAAATRNLAHTLVDSALTYLRVTP
ncbi:type 1 glutamine amidotransferase [Aeromicrobium ginsengisoli]|nr:gamma-glutamyl-gamma-aminobutyrate hydrolase family protein [Aeromicrobium ginsengisoli]